MVGSALGRSLRSSTSAVMFEIVDSRVFPFLRTLGVDGSTYSQHMEGAWFTVPTASLLVKAVDMLSDITMRDRDDNGDLYEYMLGKIASAGSSGQFRTPRHIIGLMVEMTAPGPQDESVTRLAAPGASWSPRFETTARDLLAIVRTRKTELLFLALFLRLFKPGGQVAIIVPTGCCSGPARRTRSCAGCWWRNSSSRPWSSSRPVSSIRMPACPPPSCSSPRPTPVAPTTSGSTTCRPTG